MQTQIECFGEGQGGRRIEVLEEILRELKAQDPEEWRRWVGRVCFGAVVERRVPLETGSGFQCHRFSGMAGRFDPLSVPCCEVKRNDT